MIAKEQQEHWCRDLAELHELKAKNKTQAKRIAELEAENKDLRSGHFCPTPRLAKLTTECNCAHSDKHRAIDWAIIEDLKAENKRLREGLEKVKGFLEPVEFQYKARLTAPNAGDKPPDPVIVLGEKQALVNLIEEVLK